MNARPVPLPHYEKGTGNYLGITGAPCEHHTVGHHRAWCSACSEWCYPAAPCLRCQQSMIGEEPLEAVQQLEAERDRYRAAWLSARRRAEGKESDLCTVVGLAEDMAAAAPHVLKHFSDAERLSRMLWDAREIVAMYGDVVRARTGSEDAYAARVLADIDAYRAERGWSRSGFGGESDEG